MKSYTGLAWRELKAQKVMAVLILIAVVLSTIMTTVAAQSVGILQSMRIEQAASLNGNRYGTFHELSRRQSALLHEDERLYDVKDIVNVGAVSLADSGLTMYLREYRDNALEMYPLIGRIVEGRLPERAGEIAMPEDALHYLYPEVAVGDTVRLDLRAGVMDGTMPDYHVQADLTLTGILKSSYVGYATGSVSGIAGEGTAEELLPEEYLFYSVDFKTRSRQDFQNIVKDLADSLQIREQKIQYNWVLLDALGIARDESAGAGKTSGFSFMALACVMVGILVLAAAGLVIYNILKISVAKRMKGYGTLRAIGGERGQIYRLVSLQLAILSGIGIPIGLLLGGFSAKAVLRAATGIFNPKLFMADSTSEVSSAIGAAGAVRVPFLLLSAAVTLLFAMLAAFPAARYASRVPPTVAMAGQAVKVRRRSRRDKKICKFAAYYARLNLKRGGGRTVITLLSLVMSITVFVALQSFTGLLDASQGVRDLYQGDYAVTNGTTGIPADAVARMREHGAVERLFTERLSVFMPGNGEEPTFETDLTVTSHETLQLAGVDEQRLLSCVSGLKAQDQEALKNGTGCLVKNPVIIAYEGVDIGYTEVAVGDTIRVGDRTLRVVGLTDNAVTIGSDGYLNGVQILVNDEVFCEATGTDLYAEVCPTLKEGADEAAFEAWLDQWCANLPGTNWISYQKSADEMAESFEQIRLLCWVLILFIGLIGVLNIINTVYSNIHTRVGEIGMLRAIGMSAEGMYQMFLWEGAYYGLSASVIGGIAGYVCCVLIGAARTDSLQPVAFPFASTGWAAVVSIAACLLATAIPLRSVAGMNIVESIETVE